MLAAVQSAGRSEPADDRRLVARRRAVPSRRSGSGHVHLARGLELYDPAFHRRASGRPGSSRASSAAASYRARCRCAAFPIRAWRARQAVAQAAPSITRSRSPSRCSSRSSPCARRTARGAARPTSSSPSSVARGSPRRCSGPRRFGAAPCSSSVKSNGPARWRMAAHTITRSALLRPYYFVLSPVRSCGPESLAHNLARRTRGPPTRPASTRTTPSTRGSRRKCFQRAAARTRPKNHIGTV